MSPRLLAFSLALVVALSGCDTDTADLVGPEGDAVATAGPAALFDFEFGFHVQNGAQKLYLIPSTINSTTPLLTCSVLENRYASGYTYNVQVQIANSEDGRNDCNGPVQRGYTYLLYAHGQSNGALIEVPLPGPNQNVDGFATLTSSGTWSSSNTFVDTEYSRVSRNVTFNNEGLFSTTTYDTFWEASWVSGGTFALPTAVDVTAKLTYRTSSGGQTTRTILNGVGNGAEGTWSAQAGSSLTMTVTDKKSGTGSSEQFTVASGGGGGTEPPCKPGMPGYPYCF